MCPETIPGLGARGERRASRWRRLFLASMLFLLAGETAPVWGQSCDDGNPCTADVFVQNQGCTHTPDVNLTCDDGNDCTSNDGCDLFGNCRSGPPASLNTPCNDGNDCTSSSTCNDFGECLPTILVTAGALCDDGNACTLIDQCDGLGFCRPGTTYALAATSCSDGNPCTANDVCDVDGRCRSGLPASGGTLCNDGNACTQGDACDGLGACRGPAYAPAGAACQDGSFCTQVDQCDGYGGCRPGTPASSGTACNDGNDCTQPDACDAFGVCRPGPAVPAFTSCNDGNVCTQGEQCNGFGTCGGGTAAGTTVACNDDNDCTRFDHCNGTGGCTGGVAVTAGAACEDGNECTRNDTCNGAGVCQAGPFALSGKACDDEDACTSNDQCDGSGVCQPGPSAPAGRVCEDGNTCTRLDQCNGSGTCSPGGIATGLACDDGEPCRLDDACNSSAVCVPGPTAALAGTPCDDEDLCTISDGCDGAGSCQGGGSRDCEDGNDCTTNTCDSSQGCTRTRVTGGGCDDGDACTVGDTCNNGTCMPGGSSLSCEDGNPCTTNACTPGGGCNATPVSGPMCEDGNACTVNDTCGNGICLPGGASLSCEDGDPCTVDTCSPGQGCVHAPRSVGSCSDGDPCTVNDACSSGICVPGGTSLSCDDGNGCTDDSCSPGQGCVHAPQSVGSCGDGNACTVNDTCSNGICVPGGTSLSCGDASDCTTDSCDPVLGCLHTPKFANTPCDDGNACTGSDQCDGSGICQPGSQLANPGTSCGDGNACMTGDTCDALGNCQGGGQVATSGTLCEDGNACTEGDTCDGSGNCQPGSSQPSCDDGNDCTTDSCTSGQGCLHSPAAGSCDDGDPCTAGDTCGNGACQPGGTILACSDGDDCTTDFCTQSQGCLHSPAAGSCDDGDACTVGDTCSNGSCQPGGTSLSCNDGNPCTTDSCSPGVGCVHAPQSVGSCSDGNACTVGDTCSNGSCQPGGTPLSCDDGNSCTTDSCNPQQGCLVAPQGGDPYEMDNECVISASLIQGGETQSHNFCPDTTDWLEFQACAGRSYTIETSNLGTNTDTLLELYDTNCSTLLAADDNGGPGLASRIAWTAPTHGKYRIKARQAAGQTGSDRTYDIALQGDTSPCSLWSLTEDGALSGVAVQQACDGGFIVAAQVNFFESGREQFWVQRYDLLGVTQWRSIYGLLTHHETPASIRQTADGGFVVAGTRSSALGTTDQNLWVLKLDSSGNVVWQESYGGSGDEEMGRLIESSDGGFVVAASTDSSGAGGKDFWVVKLDPTGGIVWQRTYGGSQDESAVAVRETFDGGFVVAGSADSFTGSTRDAWVLRLDATGSIVWQRAYGAPSGISEARSVEATGSGGFLVAGTTDGFGAGGADFWILELDSAGAVVWQRTYGGSLDDRLRSSRALPGGGYIVAGSTDSFGAGGGDAWLLRLDASGGILWQKTYGGTGEDAVESVEPIADGGFIAAGRTRSFADPGGGDLWLLKLDADGELGGGCTFPGATTVTPVPSTPTTTATNATGPASGASSTPTTVTAAFWTGTTLDQCRLDPPSEVSPPDSVEPLRFTGPTSLVWEQASANGSATFHLYRGDLTNLPGYGTCYQTNIPTNSTTIDSSAPADHAGWFYLVTGENALGEGPMGAGSSDAPRPNGNPCP